MRKSISRYWDKRDKRCRRCREFFARYRCAAETHGECDCPKCQGNCQCGEELDPDRHYDEIKNGDWGEEAMRRYYRTNNFR